MATKRKFTEYEDRFIRENVNRLMDWEIAEHLGLRTEQIKSFRFNRGIKRDRAVALARGRWKDHRLPDFLIGSAELKPCLPSGGIA